MNNEDTLSQKLQNNETEFLEIKKKFTNWEQEKEKFNTELENLSGALVKARMELVSCLFAFSKFSNSLNLV